MKNDKCNCRVIHQERIDQARKHCLGADEINDMSLLFKTMADPTRMKILLALAREEMCVCDLAAFLGVSESAVSHQLRTLRQMKIVSNRRQGAILYYRLSDNHISQLVTIALEHIRE